MSAQPQESPQPYRLRSWRPEDEAAVLMLFERCFGKRVSAAHWRWKLKGRSGKIENVWLAAVGEQLVFQYAGIEMPFRMFDQLTSMMVSVDTMSAPDYRRKGLLTEIASEVYEGWRRQGSAFVMGLPNQQWGSRLAALGFGILFPYQWLTLPVRPQALLARQVRMPSLVHLRPLESLWHARVDRRLRWPCAKSRVPASSSTRSGGSARRMPPSPPCATGAGCNGVSSTTRQSGITSRPGIAMAPWRATSPMASCAPRAPRRRSSRSC
jgi:Acetyltransferase (GNAT) domain